jgi:FMN phosphatase YigB (HAD superfamily)
MNSNAHKPVIVLDAGGVLVDYDVAIVYDELLKRHHIEFDPEAGVHMESLFDPLQVGSGTWHDIPPALNHALGIVLPPEEWKDLWCSSIIGEMPGMREALTGLKTGFRLIALSNTIAVHWDYLLKKFPIFSLLDGWIVSYLEGTAKPDPGIFKSLQNRYCNGRPPFFFTDDTDRHIETARKLGWPAKVFQGVADFTAAVDRLKGLNG